MRGQARGSDEWPSADLALAPNQPLTDVTVGQSVPLSGLHFPSPSGYNSLTRALGPASPNVSPGQGLGLGLVTGSRMAGWLLGCELAHKVVGRGRGGGVGGRRNVDKAPDEAVTGAEMRTRGDSWHHLGQDCVLLLTEALHLRLVL